jgi:hypothetical protein
VFIWTSSKFMPHVASPVIAEALAMWIGTCCFIGANAIEAQSDSMEVIQYCSG